jgi:hypothetical protein
MKIFIKYDILTPVTLLLGVLAAKMDNNNE